MVEKIAYNWAIPEELDIPPDPLRARLDFHHQAVVLTLFGEETATTKVVSAYDVAHALANELSFGTGLLPPNTLWWENTRAGPYFGIYVEPKIRTLALQKEYGKAPKRFTIPLPGFIFLCSPGKPPWVYAVKKKPTKERDVVYKAPLCNVFETGKSCPGDHRYPERVADIPNSFFLSYFTETADLSGRSLMFNQNVAHLWAYLDGKKRFPKNDLVQHGTVQDLMMMEMA